MPSLNTSLFKTAINLLTGMVLMVMLTAHAFSTTPLHWAARKGDTAAITTLLYAGADPNARDKNGKTPLDLISEDSPAYKSPVWWRLNDAKNN